MALGEKCHLDISQELKKKKGKHSQKAKEVQYSSKKNARKDDPLNRISGVDSNPIVVFYNTDMKRTVCMQSDQWPLIIKWRNLKVE